MIKHTAISCETTSPKTSARSHFVDRTLISMLQYIMNLARLEQLAAATPVAFNIQDLSTKGPGDVPGFCVSVVSGVILDLFEVPPLYIHTGLVSFQQ